MAILWKGVWWTPSGLEMELLMLGEWYTEAARVAYLLAIGGF